MQPFDWALVVRLGRLARVPRRVVGTRRLTSISRSVLTTFSGLLLLASGAVAAEPAPSTDPDFKAISAAVLASKPVGYWPLHERIDSTSPDAVGKHDAKLEPGVAGYKAEIPRANFVGGRALAELDKLADNYSVELWFWNDLPADSREITGYLFSRGEWNDGGTDAGDHLGIGGNFVAPGKLIFFNGTQQNVILSGQTLIGTKAWHHAVLVREKNHLIGYLDGAVELQGDAERGYAAGNAQLTFGGRNDRLFGLRGRLTDMAIYDRVLAAKEIADHCQASKLHAAAPAAEPVAQGPQPEFPPLSPQESLKGTHVRDGFEMELMAAEPMVVDPVAIEWGPDGKLWVVEMADYPVGIDGKMKPGGRIRYLEDTDGDGKYDKSTLFMSGVNFPTGVLPWRSGVIVTAAPEIFYAADTNGDGKADLRETLYRGFVEGNTQLRVNGLQWGLDGWVYCANGWSGGEVRGEKSGVKVGIGGRDFRIHLEDNQADAQSGVSEFGRNRDDWGNWFGCDNAHPLFHFVLADQYLRRNPHAAPPDTKVQVIVPESPKVFAVSPPEKRFHSFADVERFTSACSAIIYRDRLLFDGDVRQHTFVCEPVHNLVHHEVLTAKDSTFTAARPPEERESEFIASEDRWFKPVQVRTGPDGALWVVDMYRYMVEHPEWLPPEGKAATAPFLRLGDTLGRLYRVYPKGAKPRAIPKLSRMTTLQLVSALESSNGWQRDMAQQLLAQRKDRAAIAPLTKLATSSPEPLARLQALCTLDLIGAADTVQLVKSLADSHPGVRSSALRIAERSQAPEVINAAIKLTQDKDPQVRLQLAYSLGAWPGEATGKALGELWVNHHRDPYLAAAVFSSLNRDTIGPVITAALAAKTERPPLDSVLAQAAAMRRLDLIAQVLSSIVESVADKKTASTNAKLASLLDALDRTATPLDAVIAAAPMADTLRQGVDRHLSSASAIAFDDRAELKERLAAIPVVGRSGDSAAALKRLAGLLEPKSPPELQQAVVAHLARGNGPKTAALLLSGWPSHAPQLRAQILDALLGRPEWMAALLDALEKKTLAPADFDASSRQRLAGSPDANLRARTERLFASAGDAGRKQVLADHQGVLDLKGDIARGGELFKTKFAVCHRFGDTGQEVGPNLAALTDKSPRSLLTAMLDPNQAVETRYLSYVAQTDDGRSLNGIVQSETATSITLLTQNGQQAVVLRGNLEALQATGKSLMPEGLEKDLNPQQLADLIEFLQAPPPK